MAATSALVQQIVEALARGDKITAIKLARQARGGSLKEAVELLESMSGNDAKGIQLRVQKAVGATREVAGQHHQQSHAQTMQAARQANNRKPTVVMGDAPGAMRWVMIVLGLLALAVWLMLG